MFHVRCKPNCDGWDATPAQSTATGMRRRSGRLICSTARGHETRCEARECRCARCGQEQSAHICPLICEHGFRADGERCTKITCRPGYDIGDDNSCEKIEVKKPTAKREEPSKRERQIVRRQKLQRQSHRRRDRLFARSRAVDRCKEGAVLLSKARLPEFTQVRAGNPRSAIELSSQYRSNLHDPPLKSRDTGAANPASQSIAPTCRSTPRGRAR
jgi:hypothetical protein